MQSPSIVHEHPFALPFPPFPGIQIGTFAPPPEHILNGLAVHTPEHFPSELQVEPAGQGLETTLHAMPQVQSPAQFPS